ncbi:hypothetical protein HPB50_028028 [Hyalomma asiaticum]|nr:hypothetical protein HPB50_028028 [Hyalomma asiaticum]
MEAKYQDGACTGRQEQPQHCWDNFQHPKQRARQLDGKRSRRRVQTESFLTYLAAVCITDGPGRSVNVKHVRRYVGCAEERGAGVRATASERASGGTQSQEKLQAETSNAVRALRLWLYLPCLPE